MDYGEECGYPPQHEGNAFVLLLENRRAFADFVAAFVAPGALAGRFDFEGATLFKRKSISETLREGERDVLWRVPLAEGEIFVFLLVEHQSDVDHAMALRLSLYMHAVWHEIYSAADADCRRSSAFRVPPILPIVLYTGEKPWNGALQLTDVIALGHELRELLPELRFRVIHFLDLAEEDFAAPGNLACALLHVVWALMKGLPGAEFARIFEALRPFWGIPQLELLCAVLYHYACAEGRRDMATRLVDVLKPKEAEMSNPEVVRKRFWEVWSEEARVLGREEGREEGRVEGEADGEARGRAEGERRLLREQLDAIRAFFARKGLPWETYAANVEGLPSHREATDFLVDLATAADMRTFLKERFGR